MESWANKEMAGARLKDERQRANLIKICESVSKQPHCSFSASCGEALRKSAWRIFSSAKAWLLCGHVRQTYTRCKDQQVVLCLSDTTELNYHGHKCTEGLGKLGSEHSVYGLGMHSVIAVSAQAQSQFLGLLGQYIWAPVVKGRKYTDKINRSRIPIEQKETYRWLMGLDWAAQLKRELKSGDVPTLVLAVSDRESDFYDYIAHAKKRSLPVLIRASHLTRYVRYQGKNTKLKDVKPTLEALGKYSLEISRADNRSARVATLEVRAASIHIHPSGVRKGKSFRMSVVFATEKTPPANEQAIELVLLCSLPLPLVSNPETVFQTAYQWIQYYQKRWMIERFHYTLKSGALQVERMQFDNFVRLKNALQLCSIIAWYMMNLLSIAKSDPETSIESIVDQQDMEVLQALSKKTVHTAKQAVLIIGKLSGFAPSKKQPLPGEKLFAQGLQTFMSIKTGFLLAKGSFYGT